MRYTIKAGVLYGEQPQQALAKIKSTFMGPVKKILREKDETVLKTDIRCKDIELEHRGDVRRREYILVNCLNEIIASAHPGYADGDDPAVVGWPVCRLPKVDHAKLMIEEDDYLLTMHNSQNYALRDAGGYEILRIMHKGLSGGWSLEDDHGFAPEILCGLFTFCRYIEKENEFLIV